MIIATLPPLYRRELFREIIRHPLIGGVRYNTGMQSSFSVKDTVLRLKTMAEEAGKQLWLDLKGRQLRITHWDIPTYGKIAVNHRVHYHGGDAMVYFRGESTPSRLIKAKGNILFVDPPPASAVGRGQALNIVGGRVTIDGYLTKEDRAYIEAARDIDIDQFMLSFVETAEDCQEILDIFPQAQLVQKIESPAGVDYVMNQKSQYSVLLARDDLFTTIGQNKSQLLRIMHELIVKYPNAVVASRIFSGLEKSGTISLADLSDIRLCQTLGYRHYLLSDTICHRHFAAAMECWAQYFETFPFAAQEIVRRCMS